MAYRRIPPYQSLKQRFSLGRFVAFALFLGLLATVGLLSALQRQRNAVPFVKAPDTLLADSSEALSFR